MERKNLNIVMVINKEMKTYADFLINLSAVTVNLIGCLEKKYSYGKEHPLFSEFQNKKAVIQILFDVLPPHTRDFSRE